jgi:hypothetical protein
MILLPPAPYTTPERLSTLHTISFPLVKHISEEGTIMMPQRQYPERRKNDDWKLVAGVILLLVGIIFAPSTLCFSLLLLIPGLKLLHDHGNASRTFYAPVQPYPPPYVQPYHSAYANPYQPAYPLQSLPGYAPCPHCGANVKEGEEFCHICNTMLDW